jgi:hypothetical protein
MDVVYCGLRQVTLGMVALPMPYPSHIKYHPSPVYTRDLLFGTNIPTAAAALLNTVIPSAGAGSNTVTRSFYILWL